MPIYRNIIWECGDNGMAQKDRLKLRRVISGNQKSHGNDFYFLSQTAMLP